MNVLIISREYPPESVGGTATVAKNTAIGLADYGNKIYVVSNGIMPDKKMKSVKIIRTGVNNIYEKNTSNKYKNLVSSKKIFDTAKKVIINNKIQIIIVPDMFCFNEAKVLGDLYEVPVVLICLQSFFTQQVYDKNDHFVSSISKGSNQDLTTFEKNVMREAKNIVFISESIATEMLNKYNVSANTKVIYLGVDLNEIDGIKVNKPILNSDLIQITANARLVPVKGIVQLVLAFSLLANKTGNIHLNIIGDGPDFDLLRKICSSKFLKYKVTLFKQIPRNMALQVMKESDFGVVPSLWESFCYVATEFMALGVPILVSNIDSLKEICPMGIERHINPGLGKKGQRIIKPKILATKLFKMITLSDEKLKLIKKKGRKRRENKFNNDNYSSELNKFLIEIRRDLN